MRPGKYRRAKKDSVSPKAGKTPVHNQTALSATGSFTNAELFVVLTAAVVRSDLQADYEHGESERDGDERHAKADSQGAEGTANVDMYFEGEIVLLLVLWVPRAGRIEEDLQARTGADEG